MAFNIAIDGPAGAGKSTIARMAAARLSYLYVDTGAMYRAMALFFLREGIAAEDEAAISAACDRITVTLSNEGGEQQVFLNGENVNGYIRTEEVGRMTSATSVYRKVREKLTQLQRELARTTDLIMDGRDIGTCVLPEAQVKVYLTASVETRAKRRFLELQERGTACDLQEIEEGIRQRDAQDMGREISPLRQAQDAVLVDSSHMSIEEVVDVILGLVEEKRKQPPKKKMILARTAGFCFGVRRAVETACQQAARQKGKIYTYGPIIHNEKVVDDLKAKGVDMVNTLEELKGCKDGTVIIRSHGVGKAIYDLLEEEQIPYVDATCPFVLKIHRLVERYSRQGFHVVIIGNSDHPEVEGIQGWCAGVQAATVISTREEAEDFALDEGKKVCIVSQTTFHNKKFKELVEIIRKKRYDIIVLNTICSATHERQEEARRIARKVDAMLVIGGKNSSNTQKLFEICNKECKNTCYLQTQDDLDMSKLESINSVGITAGASTPNEIIEEVQKKMSEMSFEQMLDESFKTIRNGEVVEGTVIDVKPDEIILNIGYKSDGIITRTEYTNEPNVDLTTVVSMGDTMEAKVLKVNDGEGQVILTYKRLAAEKGSKKLEEAFNAQEVMKAKVTQVLDGGLGVVVDETRIFIPASLVSDTYEKDLGKYKDQEIEFVITEFNPRRRRIIGDRKQLLVARKEELQRALFERINVGDVLEGTVKNVTDFGAFIDLGGADGLLHISEMSWGRVENPKKVFKVGQVVKVFIKDIKEKKIALSMKFEDENPWNDASTKYAAGNIVNGVVARMTDFGAFVELAPGVDALLHVSQISREHVDKPADVLKIGQEIEAKIVDFNEEEKKISLSIKALLSAREAAARAAAEAEEAEAVAPAEEAEASDEAVTSEASAEEA